MSLKTRVKAFMAADKPPVATELGATGTSVFAGLLYEEDYNSDLQGEKALKVYDKMRRSDGQVKAGLLACKLPLMVARWDMTPASQEEQDVEIAGMVKEDLFENMTITWDDFLRQALIMLDFGHMAFEKVWELRDGRYTWHKLAPRLPQSIAEWHVKDDGDLDFIIQQANIGTQFKRIPIPADKLLIFSHEKEGSNFRGISLLRAAYKHWWYKNNLYAIDGIAAERHGVGLADFTYPDQATDAQKAAVKEVGERLHAHERAYTAHPESIKFDLKGVQGQLHDIKGSIDHHDLQIVRSILAQFMNLGAKSTGSYALSQDQSQFFLMALQAVGKNVCNTVNRNCIREMVDYNWDVKKYPHLTVSGLDSPDILAYAGAIAQLMTAGAITNDIPTENELRRMVKLPQKQTVVPELPKDTTKDETAQPTQPVPAGQVGEKGDTAENIVEGAKLNGIQITASLEVLNDLIAKSIPPEVALELLVAVGIDRDKAQTMVNACKILNPAQPPPSETKPLKATEFWRAPAGVEKSVAFTDIKKELDSFEDQFVKAVMPIQKRQAAAIVKNISALIQKGDYEKMTEVEMPFRTQVADAIQGMLAGLVDYGADQVKQEAKRQGVTNKAGDLPNPPDPTAFIRVRSLAIANILANRLRAALAWEALRQMREGQLVKGELTATIEDLSDQALRSIARQSATEALNLGRDEQAKLMNVREVTSSALMDDNTCDYCRSKDGTSWAPGEEPMNEPPYDDCEGRDHCRCIWVFTFAQEV